MNNLSRNKPLAFVVGAAGFIGSHVTEKLLDKGIQVIGCDNFYSGKRENLTEAGKNKDFHLLSQSIADVNDFELPRLDYAVFSISEDYSGQDYGKSLRKFLDLCEKYTPKVIFCSSINLYDEKHDEAENLKKAEKLLASVALDKKINARVVRLASIFGPRMHFRGSDPMVRLIKAAASNKINEEQTPLEFTTRALFIDDAVNLLIKALLHGATAQKIYDGALTEPVKVAEIKQLLMDPVWYEEKGFKPTELPPWTTPNLNKTIKELSWKPHTSIITALKETLNYFKDHPENMPKEPIKSDLPSSVPWQFSKLSAEYAPVPEKEAKSPKKIKSKKSWSGLKQQMITTTGITVIFLAIIFPLLRFGISAIDIKIHLENSVKAVSGGNFEEAMENSNKAVGDALFLKNSLSSVAFLRQIPAVKDSFDTIEQSLNLVSEVADANLHTVAGAKLLSGGLSIISGESGGDSSQLLADAKTELAAADSEIGQVSANLTNSQFTSQVPAALRDDLKLISEKINSYQQTISLGRSLTDLLPQIIGTEGEKNYLVVLEDNRNLRPGGGVIRSYVVVTFVNGKLKEIKGDMAEKLDSAYSARIDPPVELKTDLGEANWRLKDAAFDPDFPTSARNIAWFFGKETGIKVSGVVAIDLQAASKLLEAMGPLKIGNFQDEVNSTNIGYKIPLGREGNQASADVLKALVERIFYLSKQNWVMLAKNSSDELVSKHMLIYLSDPTAYSYLSSKGWVGEMPIQTKEIIGERNDSLAISESNMSSGVDSTAVNRSLNLESNIDEKGVISHKLTLNFEAQEKLSGIYKARVKVYLTGGTKLIKSTFGGVQMKDIGTFSDFGKAGYSMLLTIGAGEQKQLVLEYQDLNSAKFDSNNELKYRLVITKQPDQEAIPVSLKFTFPPSYKADTGYSKKGGEISANTKLSADRIFSVDLTK